MIAHGREVGEQLKERKVDGGPSEESKVLTSATRLFCAGTSYYSVAGTK